MINIIAGLTMISSIYLSGNGVDMLSTATKNAQSNSDTNISHIITKDLIPGSDIAMLDSKTVEAYIREEFADTPILVEIARCESAFRQFDREGHIVRGKVNKADVGVMQINEKYHAEDSAKLGMNIYTMDGNVSYARHLFKKFGAQPWSASEKCWGPSQTMARR